jgi:S-methylmethionine-dependent homocysteine/selenocysteine methylase
MTITILDGGMGGELIQRGFATRGGLWSAQALIDAPEAVVQLHRDYIDAGARIVATNTYSTIPSYLEKQGLQSRFVELTRFAAELARRAADESGADVWVAGSLPPLAESYRPDLVPADDVALPIYLAMAEALEPLVDLFLCETMSSGREAYNAASQAKAVARRRSLPVLVSFTLDESPGRGLRSGESIADAFALLAELDLGGFLINCTSLEAIEHGLGELRRLTDKPIGAYPNRMTSVPSGWTLDNEIRIVYRDDLDTQVFVEAARRFRAAGATILGGCCGIGPEHIRALATATAESA